MIDDQLHSALQDEHSDVVLANPVSQIVHRGRSLRRQHRRRRVAALTLIPALGLTGAAAAGALPSAISELLPWTTNAELASVDWDTAERVTVLPTTDGQRVELWSAAGDDGMTCMTHFVVGDEAPESTRLADSSRASNKGAACAQGVITEQEFSVSSISRGTSTGVFIGSAGDAVRVELELLDGQVVPLVVEDGWVLGTFDGTGLPATVIGYGTDNQRIKNIDLIDQTATIG